MLELHGWGELQTELNTLSKKGAWEQMSGLIDDEVVGTFAVVSPPDEVARILRARFGDIVTRVTFYAPYQIEHERLRGFWTAFAPDSRSVSAKTECRPVGPFGCVPTHAALSGRRSRAGADGPPPAGSAPSSSALTRAPRPSAAAIARRSSVDVRRDLDAVADLAVHLDHHGHRSPRDQGRVKEGQGCAWTWRRAVAALPHLGASRGGPSGPAAAAGCRRPRS